MPCARASPRRCSYCARMSAYTRASSSYRCRSLAACASKAARSPAGRPTQACGRGQARCSKSGGRWMGKLAAAAAACAGCSTKEEAAHLLDDDVNLCGIQVRFCDLVFPAVMGGVEAAESWPWPATPRRGSQDRPKPRRVHGGLTNAPCVPSSPMKAVPSWERLPAAARPSGRARGRLRGPFGAARLMMDSRNTFRALTGGAGIDLASFWAALARSSPTYCAMASNFHAIICSQKPLTDRPCTQLL